MKRLSSHSLKFITNKKKSHLCITSWDDKMRSLSLDK
jgi:hypothetical protein